MLGRKVATYSKRKPFSVTPSSGIEPDNNETLSNTLETVSLEKRKEEEMLRNISKSIQRLEIEHPPLTLTPAKSRKSEIRPRLSIAPSALEFNDLLGCCSQERETSFEAWIQELLVDWPKCEKIGESSFSEVFKLTNSTDESLAMKVMPLLRPGCRVEDSEKCPEPIQITNLLHEIEALKALEGLRQERKYSVPSGHTGFNKLVKCAVVEGVYPEVLLEEWDRSMEEDETFNDRPDFYQNDSLHVVLLMEFGGLDLEHYQLESVSQIHSILLQVLSSIALAEEKIQFEHRDLHLGNVLIKRTHRDDIRLGNYQTIPTAGIIANIIDCSLARFQSPKMVEFRDLAKEEWLFTGKTEDSSQYQVYRDMKEIIGNDGWDGFKPRTNLLWISHMCSEMLIKYEKLSKKETTLYVKLEAYNREILGFANTKEAFGKLLQLYK